MTGSGGPTHRLWRGLTGRGLGRGDQPLPSYSQLALRLESDLSLNDRGCSVMLAASNDERIAVEATAELGWYLAEELGREVLLVDGSFGDRGLSTVLDDGSGPGLMELLDGAELADLDTETVWAATRSTRHPSVRFLARGYGDNGRLVAARPDLLRRFLDTAVQLSDFVLLQCAPILRPGRSLAFGGLVDAVLVVALEDETRVDDLEHSHRILSGCGAKRVGLVLANRHGRHY